MALDYKATLIKMLGIPSDSSDEILVNTVSEFQASLVNFKELTDSQLVTLQNSELSLQADNEKLTNSVASLTESNTKMLEVIVNSDVAQFKDVIGDEAGVKAMLMNNREVGLKFLNSLKLTNAAAPAPVADPKPTRKAPLHNSSKAAQPEPILNANSGETEEFSVKVSNRAREIQNTNKGMGWNQSFLNARAELVAGQQIIN